MFGLIVGLSKNIGGDGVSLIGKSESCFLEMPAMVICSAETVLIHYWEIWIKSRIRIVFSPDRLIDEGEIPVR